MSHAAQTTRHHSYLRQTSKIRPGSRSSQDSEQKTGLSNELGKVLEKQILKAQATASAQRTSCGE